MKNIFLPILILLISNTSYGQADISKLIEEADSAYFDYKDYNKALGLYSDVKDSIDEKHKDFGYIVDKIARNLFNLELESSIKFDTEGSIKYSKEFIELADEYPLFINEEVLAKKYFMYKNLVVANFARGGLSEAKKYQNKLYKAYKNGELPEGIDKYYNFEFFKWDDKNVWGYEWYKTIPEDRLESSFSKIVYYIYSTNPDGSDKDQLYRLHVLMFHKADNSTTFDYVLTKRIETATEETGGTLYSYTYNDPIDYIKLRQDIREVLKSNLEPDVKSFRKK